MWGTPEPVVVSYPVKDKPSLFTLTNFHLGDLQKWLVAFAVELHGSRLRDQRSRKLADV